MNAIIVDDEIHSGNVLSSDLKKHCPEVKILHQFDDSRRALDWLKVNQVDLVFLDIMMPHLTGIQLLEAVQPLKFHVIFTTAYNQYATKAFRLSAVDFLEKPVDPDELKQAVIKVASLMKLYLNLDHLSVLQHNLDTNHTYHKIALPSQKGYDFLSIHDILYFESDGNYAWAHLVKGKKTFVTKMLKQIESILDHQPYCRIHHQYLINMEHLERYERGDGGEVILTDGTKLPVSRERKGDFLGKIK